MKLRPRTLPALLTAALLVTTTLLVAAGCSSSDKADPDEQLALHREFALRYYDDGDMPRAQDQVEKALAISPKDEQLRLMKGWIHQRKGSSEDIFIAEGVFRDLAPKKDYRALLGLGQALERKGVLFWESFVAVSSGERLTASGDPAGRAVELEQKARAAWDESIDWFKRSLEEKPGQLQAVNGLQRVHALSGNHEASLKWADKLLEQSGAEVDFWRNQLDRPDLAASEERRLRDLLLSSSDLQAQTHIQASTLLVQLEREEEALEHLDRAIALDPESPELYSRRAQLLHGLKRRAEAVASLETYLRLSEEDYDHPDIVRAMQLLPIWQLEADLEVQLNSEAEGEDVSGNSPYVYEIF